MHIDEALLVALEEIAEPAGRREGAVRLAAALGGTEAFIVVADVEVGALLPAPGFDVRLTGGGAWRAFFDACVRAGFLRAELPALRERGAAPVVATGCATRDGSVLVVVGDAVCENAVRAAARLASFVTAALRQEYAASLALGREALARETAARAQALATSVNLLRGSLERALRSARASREAYRGLAEFGAALASSLDYRATVKRAAQLVVEQGFADWCVVDVRAPTGELERLAIAHADPADAPLAEALARCAPSVGPRSTSIQARALREGRAVSLAEVDDEALAAMAVDAVHLRGLEAIRPGSIIAAPLASRGEPFGVITFSTRGRDRYGDAELRHAEHLARRAALAIENARLFSAAEDERARAEAASRAKDEFLAIVSHELRTPLTAILGWTHMLRNDTLGADRRAAALATIDRNARAQAKLVEDLLDISRITTGKLRLNVQPVDPAQIVTEAIDSVRFAAEARGVIITCTFENRPECIVGDPDRLRQIVWNLLSNAVKFTDRGGSVRAVLRADHGEVEIRVEDTGAGIAPEFLPFVFEKFRQQDTGATRTHGGLGLGLAIVRHVVELHGGTIEARSEGVGRGATFVVRIPAAPASSTEASAEAEPGRPARAVTGLIAGAIDGP
jgi:signal transduction histidine kinase